MFSAIAIALSLCMDSFTTSLSYGVSKIKVPLLSSTIISLISTIVLFISLSTAGLLKPYFDSNILTIIGSMFLITIGVINLWKESLKHYLTIQKEQTKKLQFKFLQVNFMMELFLDDRKADVDHSNTLSIKEAIFLAVALSIDSLSVGFSIGMSHIPAIPTLLFTFLFNMLFFIIIPLIGNHLDFIEKKHVFWLNGMILILIGIVRILTI